ncbi:ATP-binding cassette domain-containing protein [Agromyces atrinae]|uniref:ATP-binding cassette domain-containing protein n=1 Tax=Agromyces atrinae TaxID=592376 RepID=UPI001F55ADAF|nr:ATP-binding cassette domain-containing protein [Agromyces atrinae]MCI2957301.1 ATP-binding cassette domain-containing protein [Agromyces atrinae]
MPVELTALGHRFGTEPWLFRAMDFTFHEGTVYALIGPSGSGKSTLLGILAGWIAPAEGVIAIPHDRTATWVFQNPHGVPGRSAVDHVALPRLARGAAPDDADEEARHLLERFGLGHVAGREFRALSGGEAQRLMLARAIASEPAVLLIDEPTAQLDPTTGDTVNAVIGELARDDTVVVVATHDTRTRDACSAVLDLGRFARRAEG